MKNSFLTITYQFLLKNHTVKEEDKERILYGLEGLYLTFTKLIILFLLSIFFSMTKELFLLLILFQGLRFTGFGFHASTSFQCLVLSISFFILFPLIFFSFSFSKIIYFILSLVSLFCFLLYAPADTFKRPLTNKRKRIRRKIITILIGGLYMIFLIYSYPNRISTLFLLALIIEAINIHPILYKIFHQSYRNYQK